MGLGSRTWMIAFLCLFSIFLEPLAANKTLSLPCPVQLVKTIQSSDSDVLCILDSNVPKEVAQEFEEHRSFDKAFDSDVSCFKSKNLNLPIIYSPVSQLTEYNDVRIYQEAAAKSVRRAIKAGFKAPLLMAPDNKQLKHADLVSVLGALQELYVPIQLREDLPEKSQLISNLSVLIPNPSAEQIFRDALILESGRFITRDIAGGDPERMAAPKIEEYVRKMFPRLKVEVISDVETLSKEYPLFAAVNRAANQVERHRGRIIFLEYKPLQRARKTLMLVGKGVTYDSGGADLKVGGGMVGMSRDKSGAAAVAGFMQIVSEKMPKDVHVIAALCLVRNSIGEESYLADELITSRAGVRVRVGNTDAEGRMCMADALCRMKEIAVEQNLPDPHLFTIATLTGHAGLAVGSGYTIVVDNSVAREADHARKLQAVGESHGQPFEISTLRQDDFNSNAGQAIGEDILQANNRPSTQTSRGHQIPVAFLMQATGLDKHGLRSNFPLKYSHLDIAPSAGPYPGTPSAAPIVALAKTHLE